MSNEAYQQINMNKTGFNVRPLSSGKDQRQVYSQIKAGGTDVIKKGRKLNSGIPAKIMINRNSGGNVQMGGQTHTNFNVAMRQS